MAVEVIWLDSAERDLQDTYKHISAVNPNAAVRYMEEIVAATRRLVDFPESARRYNSRYRVLVVRNHLVFYRFEPGSQRVLVSAVMDGRRNVDELMADDE